MREGEQEKKEHPCKLRLRRRPRQRSLFHSFSLTHKGSCYFWGLGGAKEGGEGRGGEGGREEKRMGGEGEGKRKRRGEEGEGRGMGGEGEKEKEGRGKRERKGEEGEEGKEGKGRRLRGNPNSHLLFNDIDTIVTL